MTEVDIYYDKIQKAKSYIEGRWSGPWPSTVLVTGTGLADITEEVEVLQTIKYTDIPNFPESTVQSHKGSLFIAKVEEKLIAILAGRWHYYEGYSAKEITLPIRVMKALGSTKVIFTNVSGGVNHNYQSGDLVLLTDHINTIPDHPLRGTNDDRLGLRFPDMLHTYDATWIQQIKNIARDIDIKLQTGIYYSLQGPSLETPAEYKMIHTLGADLVGMSTVPEVIVARHAGMTVAAISIVSNVCYPPERLTETTVEEVIAVAKSSSVTLNRLLKKIIYQS